MGTAILVVLAFAIGYAVGSDSDSDEEWYD